MEIDLTTKELEILHYSLMVMREQHYFFGPPPPDLYSLVNKLREKLSTQFRKVDIIAEPIIPLLKLLKQTTNEDTSNWTKDDKICISLDKKKKILYLYKKQLFDGIILKEDIPLNDVNDILIEIIIDRFNLSNDLTITHLDE